MIGLSTPIALAAELVNLSVEIDGWTMMPIAENGATIAIIAARNDDEVLTTDIDVVLYEKTAIGWDGSAYDPHVTKEDALIDLATEFGLPDPQQSDDWLIQFDQIDVLGYVVPRVAFGKGFFVTDPLYIIANQLPNPQPLAQGAEAAGMPAGSSAVNTGSVSGGTPIGGPSPTDGCVCEACIQSIMAGAVDQYYMQQLLTLQDAAQLIVNEVAALLSACCSAEDVFSTVNGLWSCGAWTLDRRTNASIGTDNCHYKRTVSRTRYKFGVIVCSDCSELSYSQTLTETGDQFQRTTVADADPCPAGGPDPADEPSVCRPSTGVTHTSWAPPKPICP